MHPSPDGGREIEAIKMNHGLGGWAQPIAAVFDDDERRVFRGFRSAGSPWWDYEAIRAGRRAEAADKARERRKSGAANGRGNGDEWGVRAPA